MHVLHDQKNCANIQLQFVNIGNDTMAPSVYNVIQAKTGFGGF